MVDAESSLFINRELSWLAFDARVLHEALDERTPLLERVRFLAIFANNLDEFYMVRVAGLRRQVAAGVVATPPDGLSPQEQLEAIDRRARELHARAERCLEELLPQLEAHGIRLLDVDDLTPTEWGGLDGYFERDVFPILTPLAVDPGHPFPYISNLSLSLAVEVRDPDSGDEHFARVKVPRNLPRWVPVPGRTHHFVPLEQVIGANLGALFPGMEVVGWYPFRITRYSDLELTQAEEPEDLLATIEEQVFQRRFGEVVRLEVRRDTPAALRALLVEELRDDEVPGGSLLTERDVHEGGRLLALADLVTLADVPLAELHYPPFSPTTPIELRDGSRSIFDVIRERDVLVHHPFDAFATTVERFFETAAEDPDVLAIKVTLYRTSGDTAIVQALTEAAQRGKQVAVIVELKARFDEANNITWARTLESYGIHVAYGSASLKTHAKVGMVVRRDPDGIRRYIHLGTGNYNSKTARIYTDVALFTANPSIGADVSDLFNSLTGYSRQRRYRQLSVAPLSMRDRFLELIARESEHARAGRPARVVAKMNALVDAEIIRALYRASQAGVEVDLIVRGICCLRPGLSGVSERIRVISVVGRFLEHSRLWRFENGGAREYYLGSADWMPRNFDRRVEAVAPILDAAWHLRIDSLLETLLRDDRQAWQLEGDGVWRQRTPANGAHATHELLLLDSWGQLPPPTAPAGEQEESPYRAVR